MKQGARIGLTFWEGARRYGDSDILAALAAAEAEAARLEALDYQTTPYDTRHHLLKRGAYSEADFHRCQLLLDLRRRLQQGELMATAREHPTAAPVAIAPGIWATLSPHFEDNTCRDGFGAVVLYDARITIAEPEEGRAAEPESAPEAPVPMGSVTRAEPTPVYSLVALRSWYRLRAASWPASQPPPSEADDLAAATMHFNVAIPRDRFRAIRRELAPDAWKKPGPRQPRK